MMIIDNLLKHITNENLPIIDDISDTIIEYKVKDVHGLIDLEEYLFQIDGKKMTQTEKIDYCINIINSNKTYLDDLDYNQSLKLIDLKKKLQVENEKSNQIILIIKIYSIMNITIPFIKEAYDFIISDRL